MFVRSRVAATNTGPPIGSTESAVMSPSPNRISPPTRNVRRSIPFPGGGRLASSQGPIARATGSAGEQRRDLGPNGWTVVGYEGAARVVQISHAPINVRSQDVEPLVQSDLDDNSEERRALLTFGRIEGIKASIREDSCPRLRRGIIRERANRDPIGPLAKSRVEADACRRETIRIVGKQRVLQTLCRAPSERARIQLRRPRSIPLEKAPRRALLGAHLAG
jgi:hypothetical protein